MNILERALRVISVEHCIECGVEGTRLCSLCRSNYELSAVSACYRCNATTSDFSVCKSCKPKTSLAQVFVAAEYEAVLRQLIHIYKFDQARSAAQPLASLLEASLPYFEHDDIVFAPIPTAARRVRQRGFDHAVLLCQHVAALRNTGYSSPLVRLGNKRQVGATRQLRFAQMQHAFRVRSTVTGQTICLIDDVTTTGATLEAAADVLKRAGAKRVIAAVVVRG